MHNYFSIFNHAFTGLFIAEIIEKDGYTEIFSQANSGIYWNAVNTINLPSENIPSIIEQIETDFTAKDRIPAFWITEEDMPNDIESILQQDGYIKDGMDHWMIYKGKPEEIVIEGPLLDVQRIESTIQIEDFMCVFVSGWDDSDGQYKKAYTKNVFDPRYKETSKLYVGYVHGIPVTIAGYVTYENYAILHSVATAAEYRNKGFAKQMTKFILQECSGKNVFLQTDVTEGAYSVYKKLNFEDLMDVKVYAKNIQA